MPGLARLDSACSGLYIVWTVWILNATVRGAQVRTRFFASLTALTVVATALSLTPAWAQGAGPGVTGFGNTDIPPRGDRNWKPSRTVDGQPDIQGLWDQRNDITTYSIQAGAADRAQHVRLGGGRAQLGKPIVDPKNGLIPYQPWAAEKAKFLYAQHLHPSGAANLDPVTRGFLEGVPRINYMGLVQIIQVPGYVVMAHEYGHHYRVIPLDGRPHLPGDIKLWMGDSRGHWEGNTLVVDVTNNNDQTWFDIVGSFHSDALHMVERWTFVGPDRIEYDVTMTDPKVFARPWKLVMTLGRNEPQENWENAVWEGNRAADVIMGTEAEKSTEHK